MPTRGSKDPNGRALRGRRAHTTFALLSDPVRQIWNSFNNRANAGGADAPEAAVNGCLYDRFKSLYTKTATKPSLVIVPARFKSGTLYSQIPSSNADFTVTRPLNTATRFDSSALIQTGITSGVPRLDYYTSGGVTGCPALLVEPAGTNLARFVNQMTAQDIPAASGGMTTTTGSTDFLAPDGTSGSITKYVGGAASGTSQYAYYTGGGIVASASGAHTYSLFVRRGAINPLNFCALGIENYAGGSGTIYSYFNLASGTALTAGASVQNYGNGWYRLTTPPYTLAAGDLNGTLSFFMAEGNGDLSWPVSGALNLTAYTWGSQFEAGSIATSYIPTTTGTGSRSADVISVTGAVSGSIGQTEGTIYVEGVITNYADAAASFITISDNTINNRLEIRKGSPGSILFERESATQSASTSINATGQLNGIFKMAVAYKSGDTAFFINGFQVATTNAATFTMNTLTHIYLGNNASGSARRLNDRIRAVALYTTRLNAAELATLTTL